MLRQLASLFIALLIVLIAFVWVERYSFSFQQCVSDSTANAATQNSANQNNPIPIIVRSYVRCTERFANRYNSLITALATVLLAVITYGLILSGVDQQHTARAQLRAYVMIQSVALTEIHDGGQPDAHITLKNFGQTPATHVSHWARLIFSTFPEPARPLPGRPNEDLPESTMAPGATMGVVTGLPGVPLPPEIIAALRARTHAFYVLGEVRYMDAFGKQRETDFLLFCTAHLVADGTVASHHTGNRIT
jgi:hypothetical protein